MENWNKPRQANPLYIVFVFVLFCFVLFVFWWGGGGLHKFIFKKIQKQKHLSAMRVTIIQHLLVKNFQELVDTLNNWFLPPKKSCLHLYVICIRYCIYNWINLGFVIVVLVIHVRVFTT